MPLSPRIVYRLTSLTLFTAIAGSARGQGVALTRAEAVARAIGGSPRSTMLAADTSAALGAAISASALPNPTLSAVYSKDTPNYHVTADYPVDFFRVRGLKQEAARFGRDAARYRFSAGRALIALDADTTYTRALAAAAKSRLSARTALDVDSLLRMVVARRNAGDASELDVQLATVSAARQANVAASDSLTAISALLDLQALLGLSTSEQVVTLADSLTPPPADAMTSPASTLPVAAAEAAVRAAELDARLQRRSVWSGTGIMFGVEAGDPGGNGGLLPTFGLSLPLPFFDRNRGGIAQADAEHARANAELTQTKLETSAAIARATRERANAAGRIERDRITVAAADRVAAMSLTAYREGAMALPNVLEAQRTAREALSEYIDDLAAAWIASATFRALTIPVGARE